MDGRARWRRPWPRLALEVADGLLGLAVAAVQLLLLGLGVNQGPAAPFADPNGLAVALILLQGLPLTWRRRQPLGVFAVVLAANTAYYAIGFPPSQFDFGLPLALFSVAAERDRRTSLAALVTVQGLLAAQWLARLGPHWANAGLGPRPVPALLLQRHVGLGPVRTHPAGLRPGAGGQGRAGRAGPPAGGRPGRGRRAGPDRP